MTKTEREMVDAALAAKDQTIIVLTDVVDHLRALLFQEKARSADSGTEAKVELPAMQPIFDVADAQRLHMSDEEEDIEYMRAQGALTDEQADAALQIVGARGPIQLVK
jgi:hypothetical protein